MKRKFLISLQEKLVSESKEPWSCFETCGPDKDGRLEFSISWNKAFVDNLHNKGFQGLTDEETVQMFFLSTHMLPESMVDDDSINPAEMPNLTSEANTLIR